MLGMLTHEGHTIVEASHIIDHIDRVGSDSAYISVSDLRREKFGKHPWSLSGGGETALKQQMDEAGETLLSKVAEIGIGAVTLEDEAFQISIRGARRSKVENRFLRSFVVGVAVRDWMFKDLDYAIFPYESDCKPAATEIVRRRLWPLRTGLNCRLWFKKTQIERGFCWFEYGHISWKKFRTLIAKLLCMINVKIH